MSTPSEKKPMPMSVQGNAEKTEKTEGGFNFAVLRSVPALITYLLALIGVASQIVMWVLPSKPEYAGLFALFFIIRSFMFLSVFYLVFLVLKALNYFSLDRNKVMSMFIGMSIPVLFAYIDSHFHVLEPIEEYSINVRFRLMAENQTIQIVNNEQQPMPLDSAHKAIHIIGIDNRTVNAFQGFPFSWGRYAALIKAFQGSNLNTIMFDVFMLDNAKNNYGLLDIVENIREKISVFTDKGQSLNYSNAQLRGSSSKLSDIMAKNGKVILDYGFETENINQDEFNSPDFQGRLKELEKFRIPDLNIEVNDYLQEPNLEWVTYPAPPIIPIGKAVKGLGGANVKYNESGVNYQMPMVFKWRNKLYPSISLLMACRYYGVDVTKDVKVKLGSFVKITNIPQKKVKMGMDDTEQDIMTQPNPERTVTIPIDKIGMMNINFIGASYSFPSTSFHEIIQSDKESPGAFGKANPDYFGNKILLVAMFYATGAAKDIHPGPFGNVAGIEHHASALNTILKQDFLSYAPAWLNYGIFLLMGIALGFAVPRFNIGKVLLITVALSIVFLTESLFVFKTFKYLHTFLVPYIVIAVVLIAIIAYKVLAEEENVKYIRSTFSKFVSKDVVNELLANPESLKLGGEKKALTVFFSDIRGFTTMSESLTPEDLVHLLNEYLSTMTELVLAYKGTIDKYMGDAIMAFWGAPVKNKDHAYFGCIASLAQMKELHNLQERWKASGWPVIDIGIGLNSGYAVVGNMGSSHRMDYTVMGDTINLGSRLEGANKQYGTRIIISEFTYAEVKDRVIARELDYIKVKGKTEPVKIYELIDIINQADFQRLLSKVN